MQEDFDVEFKQSLSGLESEDIVAFANSARGGCILVGVEETTDANGQQRAVVVGCKHGDKAKRSVLGKAASCLPPITVDVFTENLRHKPFLRIEIQSGTSKPYSTSGGTYKIRGDGANLPMPPTMLLSMFLERESMEFWNRFQMVTENIESGLASMKDDVGQSLYALVEEAAESRETLADTLADIGSMAETAQTESEEAAGTTSEIFRDMQDMSGWAYLYLNEVICKLDSILKKHEIPDPAVNVNRDFLEGLILKGLIGNTDKSSLEKLFFRAHPAASKAQFEELYSSVKNRFEESLLQSKKLSKR